MQVKNQVNNDSIYDIFLWLSIIFLLAVVLVVEFFRSIYMIVRGLFRRWQDA